MADSYFSKIIKILLVCVVGGAIIGFPDSVFPFLGIEFNSPGFLTMPFFSYYPFSFSLANFLSGILLFIWIKDNLLARFLYGVFGVILVFPIGLIAGSIFVILLSLSFRAT